MQAVNPPPDGVRPGETQPKSRAPCLTPPAAHLTQRLVLFAPDQHSNKFNTAVGAGALFANIADNNTATGAGALLSNTTGIGNTATGSFAL